MDPKHEVALWAGAVAFFGSLLAQGIFDLITPGKGWQFLGAIFVAIVTGGSIYAKQRYDDAKLEREERKNPSLTVYKKPEKRD